MSEHAPVVDAGTQRSFGIKSAWFLVFALAVTYLLSFMDRMIITLMVEPLKRDLGLSDTQVGLLMGFSFAMFYSVFGLPIGRLADRVNRKRIIIVGIAVWSVATALGGFAQGFWALFVARVLVGAGEAALSPAALSMIADKFPREKRGPATGVFIAGGQLGSAVALIGGGALLGSLLKQPKIEGVPFVGSVFAWQSVFWIAGACGIIGILMMALVDEPKRGGQDAPGEGEVKPASSSEVIAYLKNNRDAWLAVLVAPSFYTLLVFAVLTWTPAFFERAYGWSMDVIGPVFGVTALVSGLVSPVLSGTLIQFMEKRGLEDAPLRTFLYFGAPSAIFMITAMLIGNGVLSMVFLGLGLAASTAVLATPQIGVQNIAPVAMRGQVTAMLFLLMNLLGMGGGPLIVGLITDYGFGDPSALKWSVAITVFFSAPIGLLLCQRGRKGYVTLVKNNASHASGRV